MDIPDDIKAQQKLLASILASLDAIDSERANEIRRMIQRGNSVSRVLEQIYIDKMAERLEEQYGDGEQI